MSEELAPALDYTRLRRDELERAYAAQVREAQALFAGPEADAGPVEELPPGAATERFLADVDAWLDAQPDNPAAVPWGTWQTIRGLRRARTETRQIEDALGRYAHLEAAVEDEAAAGMGSDDHPVAASEEAFEAGGEPPEPAGQDPEAHERSLARAWLYVRIAALSVILTFVGVTAMSLGSPSPAVAPVGSASLVPTPTLRLAAPTVSLSTPEGPIFVHASWQVRESDAGVSCQHDWTVTFAVLDSRNEHAPYVGKEATFRLFDGEAVRTGMVGPEGVLEVEIQERIAKDGAGTCASRLHPQMLTVDGIPVY